MRGSGPWLVHWQRDVAIGDWQGHQTGTEIETQASPKWLFAAVSDVYFHVFVLYSFLFGSTNKQLEYTLFRKQWANQLKHLPPHNFLEILGISRGRFISV